MNSRQGPDLLLHMAVRPSHDHGLHLHDGGDRVRAVQGRPPPPRPQAGRAVSRPQIRRDRHRQRLRFQRDKVLRVRARDGYIGQVFISSLSPYTPQIESRVYQK